MQETIKLFAYYCDTTNLEKSYSSYIMYDDNGFNNKICLRWSKSEKQKNNL